MEETALATNCMQCDAMLTDENRFDKWHTYLCKDCGGQMAQMFNQMQEAVPFAPADFIVDNIWLGP